MSKYFVTATIQYLAIGTGAAFAQTQSPATQPSDVFRHRLDPLRAINLSGSHRPMTQGVKIRSG